MFIFSHHNSRVAHKAYGFYHLALFQMGKNLLPTGLTEAVIQGQRFFEDCTLPLRGACAAYQAPPGTPAQAPDGTRLTRARALTV